MLERTGTRTLIPQWFGHGPLTIKVAADAVYLRADQVEQLAGIPPWAHGEQLLDADWHMFDGHPYYELNHAIARCESEATDQAAEFLCWLDAQLAELLVDEVLDNAQKVPGFIGSHSVGKAAEILDRDPQISIGRGRLFRHLEVLGWVVRDSNGTLHPTDRARRSGWVTIRNVPLELGRRQSRTYPQIYITPDGLTELRRSLHALNQTPAEPAPQPALFD